MIPTPKRDGILTMTVAIIHWGLMGLLVFAAVILGDRLEAGRIYGGMGYFFLVAVISSLLYGTKDAR